MRNAVIKLVAVVSLVFCLVFSWTITPALAFNFSSLSTLMVTSTDQPEDNIYRVIVNSSEKYSLWLAHLEIPAGWTDAGKQGSKTECIAYIQEIGKDK